MKQRRLGHDGPMVGEVGFGAMSFGGIFGATDIDTSHRTLDRCLDLGVTHLDTALIYGPHVSEEVIGAYLKKNPSARNRFEIATKGGFRIEPRGIDNSAAFMRDCLEGSLKRLGVDHVALYYIHRRDQSIPIEDVMETLLQFQKEGKIGGIGFSEIAPPSLLRAAKVGQVRAVQNEYSLWTRLPELGLLQACKRVGAAFVAFSPLGRGVFYDGPIDPLAFGDFFRPNLPRFSKDNWPRNKPMIDAFKAYATSRGWSAAALAIAWTLHRDDTIIPIPGTRSAEHLAEDASGSAIHLSTEDMAAIEEILPAGWAHGHRYSDEQQKGVEQYC